MMVLSFQPWILARYEDFMRILLGTVMNGHILKRFEAIFGIPLPASISQVKC
jgi:hypothetical protein